jgi:hypothetical protein
MALNLTYKGDVPKKQDNIPAVNFLLKPDQQTRSRLLSVLADLALATPIEVEATPQQEVVSGPPESKDD